MDAQLQLCEIDTVEPGSFRQFCLGQSSRLSEGPDLLVELTHTHVSMLPVVNGNIVYILHPVKPLNQFLNANRVLHNNVLHAILH